LLADSEVAAASVDLGVELLEGVGVDAVLVGNGVAEITSDDIDRLGASSSSSATVVVASGVTSVTAVVASSTTSSSGLDREVDAIVDGTVLGDGDEDGLMVGCCVDRAQAVATSGETLVDRGREFALAVSGQVETLEEGKDVGVQGGLALEVVNLLNGDVRVADDDALVVDLLRSGVVVGRGVHEVAALNVLDGHGDGEGLVLVEILGKVLGEDEFGGGHLVDSDDATHGSLVAGSTFLLDTIGEGHLLGEAEVDEVVGRGQ